MNTGKAALAGMPENIACTLCYAALGLSAILFLALAPFNRNRNVRFHALQSLLFTAGMATVLAIAGPVAATLSQISFLGSAAVALLLLTVLSGVLCWLALMYKAYRNERFRLPLIGPFAEKLA